MKKHNGYGISAIKAVKNKHLFSTPKEAWEFAVDDSFKSESSKAKGCPKNAFLGLCEAGFVKGIPKGNYTRSIKNKNYSLTAINILIANSKQTFTPRFLWEEVSVQLDLGKKQHSSQMDVVLALWNQNLIIL
jgi:hypothetical protein